MYDPNDWNDRPDGHQVAIALLVIFALGLLIGILLGGSA